MKLYTIFRLILIIFDLNFMNLHKIVNTMVHTKCRAKFYPFKQVARVVFSDHQVLWNVDFPDYKPVDFDAEVLKGKPWADLHVDDPDFHPKWNEIDGTTNRKSFMGVYNVVNKRPLNPEGRTGLKGRGILGKWGPNHAADPIVTRWKRENDQKIINKSTKLPILQFCAIQRRDCNQWAIPGGMVDPGEQVTQTLRREFLEEALNSLEATDDQKEADSNMITKFFENGTDIYKGYVDDPRNTDNAWMETVAMNFHDEDGNLVGKINLNAGDDAKNVKWMDIDKNLDLYASHIQFIEKTAKLHNAHW